MNNYLSQAQNRIAETEEIIGLKFAGVSGSHLYGWGSEYSDIDVRGYYIAPTEQFFGLQKPKDTIEKLYDDVDIAVWEVEKFIGLLISPNMNFIEITKLPANLRVVEDKEVNARIEWLADQCLTKNLFNHIQGMVTHMKKHDRKYNFENPKKPLYIIRELLRGILLFETGEFESDINKLASKLLVGDDLLTVQYLIKQKMENYSVEEKGITHAQDTVRHLESEMLTAKNFGVLPAEPKVDLRKEASKILTKIRRDNLEK